MKLKVAQLVARLEYASNLCSWLNVHPEMKDKMGNLIRRGLAVRDPKDNAFKLTEAGESLLADHKHLLTGKWQSGSGETALVEGAEYWLDQWNQKIPA